MKKHISVLIALLLLFSLCACGSAPQTDSAKLSVVTTIFPEYDWIMNILGDRAADADVTMLLDSGVDLHSYQPTADDIIKLGTCDVFVYTGGESDEWTEDALKQAVNKDMIVIDLMDVLGDAVMTEETVEGMETDEDEEAEPEDDEHIWLSLRNAAVCCEAIAKALSDADPANADIYAANAETYIGKLNALDEKYAAETGASSNKTLLFADRFPFRYLTEDYGLSYYAAFSGCSAESEASFETVSFLAGKLTELSLPCVLTLEGSDCRIADTLISTAGSDAEVLTVDSMQSVTDADVRAGADYLTIMEQDLETILRALG